MAELERQPSCSNISQFAVILTLFHRIQIHRERHKYGSADFRRHILLWASKLKHSIFTRTVEVRIEHMYSDIGTLLITLSPSSNAAACYKSSR